MLHLGFYQYAVLNFATLHDEPSATARPCYTPSIPQSMLGCALTKPFDVKLIKRRKPFDFKLMKRRSLLKDACLFMLLHIYTYVHVNLQTYARVHMETLYTHTQAFVHQHLSIFRVSLSRVSVEPNHGVELHYHLQNF